MFTVIDVTRDTHTPIPKVVYAIAVLGGMSGVLYGYDSGSMSGALPLITDRFGLDASGQGLLTSMLLFGALPAIVAATAAARRFDRRHLLILCGALFIIGSLGCAFAPTLTVLQGSRLVLGFACGIANQFGLIYLSELAPKRVRGTLTALYQLSVNCGILLAYIVGSVFAPSGGWRWIIGLGALPALIFMVGMIIAPSSPRFLIMRGEMDRAEKILDRLRSGPGEAHEEAQGIADSLKEQSAGLKDLFRGAYRPAIGIALTLTFFQVFTGINSVVYYAPIIFESTGSRSAGTIASYMVGIALVVSTALSLPLVERMGRKPLLIISLLGQVLPTVGIAFFPHVEWFAIGCVFLYTFAFGFGLGPVFWLICPELLPLRARALGMGVITFSQYLLNAVSSRFFPNFLEAAGTKSFLLFAALSVIGAFYVWRFVPETKGKSLEEIEEMWRDRGQREVQPV